MADKSALEFSDAGEHRQHHASSWGRGVSPWLLKRLQSCIFLSDNLSDAQQFGRRAREPVEAADDQDIVGPEFLEQLLERGPSSCGAGDLLLEQLSAVGFLQPGALYVEALILG